MKLDRGSVEALIKQALQLQIEENGMPHQIKRVEVIVVEKDQDGYLDSLEINILYDPKSLPNVDGFTCNGSLSNAA